MTPDLSAQVRSAVESICELGCDRVNEIIDSLEAGHNVAETTGLAQAEQQMVLAELKEIMAVYDSDRA